MRILVISQYFWPEEFRINDICDQLKLAGHQVEVLTGIPNYPSGRVYRGYGFFQRLREERNGVPIRRVWLIPRKKGGKIDLILNYLSFAFFASVKILDRHYRKFDVIFVYEVSPITQALPALLLRALAKIPVCLYVLDLWPESIQAAGGVNNKTVINLTRRMVKFIYRRCDRILISSKSFREHIRAFGYPDKRLEYLPNWAEETYFPMPREEARRNCPEISGDDFILMYAGNIGSAQGFDVILKAAERLKEHKKIRFIILGDGRMRGQAEKEAADIGLDNIVFLGRRPIESMPAYFACADALLVTLKKEYVFSLTMPARVQSFMACGRPVIACADGETAEVVKESGCGFACSAGDDKALAEIILKLKRMSAEEREQMGINGLKYAKAEFSKEQLVERLITALGNLKEREKCGKVF